MSPDFVYLSLGAGVQSSPLLVMSALAYAGFNRGAPKMSPEEETAIT